jgi:hypothetical protein
VNRDAKCKSGIFPLSAVEKQCPSASVVAVVVRREKLSVDEHAEELSVSKEASFSRCQVTAGSEAGLNQAGQCSVNGSHRGIDVLQVHEFCAHLAPVCSRGFEMLALKLRGKNGFVRWYSACLQGPNIIAIFSVELFQTGA